MLHQNNPKAFWYDRACLCFWSLVVIAGLSHFLNLNPLMIHFPSSSWALYPLIGAAQVICLTYLIKHAQLHYNQKGGLFTVGMIGGVVAISYIIILTSVDLYNLDKLLVIGLYFLSVIVTITLIFFGKKLLAPIQNPETSDLEILKNWLESDEGGTPNLRTGRTHQAERISNLIQSGTCKRGLVLYGEYGSGKTTLMKEVAAELPEDHWTVIHFSAWGKTQLVSLLLKEIIKGIGKRIETHQIQKLPSEIVKSLGQINPVKGIGNAILNKLQPTEDHAELLQKLNDLLVQNNHNCLVVIEDVDRGKHSEENLNTLSALFDILTISKRIKFIFTLDEGEANQVPLTKIMDHKEVIGGIDPLYALLTFIDLCRAEAKSKDIILTDLKYKQDKPLIGAEGSAITDSHAIHEVYRRSIYNSFAETIKNARDLNHTIRSAWRLWKDIMGEVNILDVLAYTIIFKTNQNLTARDTINNWSLLGKGDSDKETSQAILKDIFKPGDPLKEVTDYILNGQNGSIQFQQSVRLNKDIFGYICLEQLKDHKAHKSAWVSQRRLKQLQNIWSNDKSLNSSEINDLLENNIHYHECYLAYQPTQNLTLPLKNHGKIITGLLDHITRHENDLEHQSDNEFMSQVHQISQYYAWFAAEPNQDCLVWFKTLNKVNSQQRKSWIQTAVYVNLLQNPKFNLSSEVRQEMSAYIGKTVLKPDLEYVMNLPYKSKWAVINRYNNQWKYPINDIVLAMTEKNQILGNFIKIFSDYIFLEEIGDDWRNTLLSFLNVEPVELMGWFSVIEKGLQIPKSEPLVFTPEIQLTLENTRNRYKGTPILDELQVQARILKIIKTDFSKSSTTKPISS